MKERGVEQRWTKLSTKNRGKRVHHQQERELLHNLALQVAAFISNAFRGTANHGASTDTGPSDKVGIHVHPTIEDDSKSQRRVSNGIHTSQTEASCRTCAATENRYNGLLNILRYSRSATTFESRRMASTSPPSPGSFTCQCCQRLWRCAGSS